ncbi:MAG: hypothetical protein ABI920_15865, partial [Casimicrobiaceae bacterium]
MGAHLMLPRCLRLVRLAGIATLGAFLALPSSAHEPRDPLDAAPAVPAQGAPVEALAGQLHRLTIDDRVAGIVLEAQSLRLDDGRGIALKGDQAVGLQTGDRVEVMGRRNGKALFATNVKRLATAGKPNNAKSRPTTLQGTLALLHVDRFDEDRSEFVFEVQDAAGNRTPLSIPAAPEALQ